MPLVVLPLRGSPAEAELGEFMLPIILSQVVPAIWAWDRGLSLQEARSAGQGVGIYLKQTEPSRTMSVLCLWSALYTLKSISSEPGMVGRKI